MKKIPWDSLFYVAVLIGILNMFIIDGASAFEFLVIMLIFRVIELLRKKEIVNYTHHINITNRKG